MTNDYGDMQTNESILYNGSHVDSPTTRQLKGLANSYLWTIVIHLECIMYASSVATLAMRYM